jgi:hypothetical protein
MATGARAYSRDPREAVKYQLGVSMEIRHVPARNQLGYFTSLANKLASINGLPRFYVWTENPRVGGSIPPLATTKSTI